MFPEILFLSFHGYRVQIFLKKCPCLTSSGIVENRVSILHEKKRGLTSISLLPSKFLSPLQTCKLILATNRALDKYRQRIAFTLALKTKRSQVKTESQFVEI